MVEISLLKKATIDDQINKRMDQMKELLLEGSLDKTSAFFTTFQNDIRDQEYEYLSYIYGKFCNELESIIEHYINEKGEKNDMSTYILDMISSLRNQSNISSTSYEEFVAEFNAVRNNMIELERNALVNNNDVLLEFESSIRTVNNFLRDFILAKNTPSNTIDSPQKTEVYTTLRSSLLQLYDKYINEEYEAINELFELPDESELELLAKEESDSNIARKNRKLNHIFWMFDVEVNTSKFSENVKNAIKDLKKTVDVDGKSVHTQKYKIAKKTSWNRLLKRIKQEPIISSIYDFMFKYHEYRTVNKDGTNTIFTLINNFTLLKSRCIQLKNNLKKKIAKARSYEVNRNETFISLIPIENTFEELYNMLDFYRKVENIYAEHNDLFVAYENVSEKKINKEYLDILIRDTLIYYFFPYIVKDYFPSALTERYENRLDRVRKMKIKLDSIGKEKLKNEIFSLDEMRINKNKGKLVHIYRDIYTVLIRMLILRKPTDVNSHIYFFEKIQKMMHNTYEGNVNAEIFQDNPGDLITIGFDDEEIVKDDENEKANDNSVFNYFEKINNKYRHILQYFDQESKEMANIITPVDNWRHWEREFKIAYMSKENLYDDFNVEKQPFDRTFTTRLISGSGKNIFDKFFSSDSNKVDKTAEAFKKLLKERKKDTSDIFPHGFASDADKENINMLIKQMYLDNYIDGKDFSENIGQVRAYIVNNLERYYKMPKGDIEEDMREYFRYYSDEEYSRILEKDPNYFKNKYKTMVEENKENMERLKQFFKARSDNPYSIMFETKVPDQEGEHYVYYKIRSGISSGDEYHETLVSLHDFKQMMETDPSDDTIYHYITQYTTKYPSKYFKILWNHSYNYEINYDIPQLQSMYFCNQLATFAIHIKSNRLLNCVLKYINHYDIFENVNLFRENGSGLKIPIDLESKDNKWHISFKPFPENNNPTNFYVNKIKHISNCFHYNHVKNVNVKQLNHKRSLDKAINLLQESIENKSFDQLKNVKINFDDINLLNLYQIEGEFNEDKEEKIKLLINILENKKGHVENNKIALEDQTHNIAVLNKMIEEKSMKAKVDKKGLIKNTFNGVSFSELFTLYKININAEYQEEWKQSLQKIINYLTNVNQTISVKEPEKTNITQIDMMEIYDKIDNNITLNDILDHFNRIGSNMTNEKDNKININWVIVLVHKILYSLYVNNDKGEKIYSDRLGDILYDMQYIANNDNSKDQFAAILFLSALRKLSKTDLDQDHLIQKLGADKKVLDRIQDYLKNNDLFAYKQTIDVKGKMTKQQKEQDEEELKRKQIKSKTIDKIINEFRRKNNQKKDELEDKIKNISLVITARKERDENVNNLINLIRNTRRKKELLSKRNRILFNMFGESELSLAKVYVSRKHFLEKGYKLCEHNNVKKELSLLNSRRININFTINDAHIKLKDDPTNEKLKDSIDKNKEKLEQLERDVVLKNLQFESFLTGATSTNGQNTICNRCGEILLQEIVEHGQGSFQEQEEIRELNRHIRESGLLPIINKENDIKKMVGNMKRILRNFRESIPMDKPDNPEFRVSDIDFSPLDEDPPAEGEVERHSIMYEYIDENYNAILAMCSQYVRTGFKFVNAKRLSINQKTKVKEMMVIYFTMAACVFTVYHVLDKGIDIKLKNGTLRKSERVQYKHIKKIYEAVHNKKVDSSFFKNFNIDKKFNDSKQLNFYIQIYKMILTHNPKFNDKIRFSTSTIITVSKKIKEEQEKEIKFHKKVRGSYFYPPVMMKKEAVKEEKTLQINKTINERFVYFIYNLKVKLNMVQQNDINYYLMEKSDITKKLEEYENGDLTLTHRELEELIEKDNYYKNLINEGASIDCDVDILKMVLQLVKIDHFRLKNKHKKRINEIEYDLTRTMYCHIWNTQNNDLSKFNEFSLKDITNDFMLLYLHIQYCRNQKKTSSRSLKKQEPQLSEELSSNYNKWNKDYRDVMDVFDNLIKNDIHLRKDNILNSTDLLDDHQLLQLYVLKAFNMYKRHVDDVVDTLNAIKILVDDNGNLFKDYFDKKGQITEEEELNVQMDDEPVYINLNNLVSVFSQRYLGTVSVPTKPYVLKMVLTGFKTKYLDDTIEIDSLQKIYQKSNQKFNKLLEIQERLNKFEDILKNRIDTYNRFTNKLYQSNILSKKEKANAYIDIISDHYDLYNAITETSKKDYELDNLKKYIPKNINLVTKLNFFRVEKGVFLHMLVPYYQYVDEDNTTEMDNMIQNFIKVNKYILYQKKKDEPLYIPSIQSDKVSDLLKLYGKFYDRYLLNIYFMKIVDDENRLSKICRDRLEYFRLSLDEGGQFKQVLKDLNIDTEVYDKTMLEIEDTVKGMKTNYPMKLLRTNISYKNMIQLSRTMDQVIDIYYEKANHIKNKYRSMLLSYKDDSVEGIRQIQLDNLKLPLINEKELKLAGNREEQRMEDLEIDKETVKKYIGYGKGDRLYILKDGSGTEYNEDKIKEFVLNVFKYFDVRKGKLIKRKSPLNDEEVRVESKTWIHVPQYEKWNKMRFIGGYVSFAMIKNLINKLNLYCVENYIKNKDDHTIKNIYDDIEEVFDEEAINTEVIYSYYYENQTKFLQNVFPIINKLHVHRTDEDQSFDDAVAKVEKLLEEHEVVKYRGINNKFIIYGYNEKLYYELNNDPMWKKDETSLQKLHRDYIRNKLDEFGIKKPFEELQKLMTNPDYIYDRFPELLQRYVDRYFDIIEKYNTVVDRTSFYTTPGSILKKNIDIVKVHEDYEIHKYQLKIYNDTITPEENERLQKLIDEKRQKIRTETRRKTYMFNMQNSNTDTVEMSQDEKDHVLLRKLRTQFLTSRIMQITFSKINQMVLENLLKDTFIKEDMPINERFDQVFKSKDESKLPESLQSTYDKAKDKLFKMYDNYNELDSNMVSKFKNLFNHYPEESKEDINAYLTYLENKKEGEEVERPHFCYYLPIKREAKISESGRVITSLSATVYLNISESDEVNMSNEEIVQKYKEEFPENRVEVRGNRLFICPITTKDQMKQQIHDLSNFLDPILETMKSLSNGSYNAFLYNDKEISRIENNMLKRIPQMGLKDSPETKQNLNNFILSFDKKSVKKFMDASSKPITTFETKGETSLAPADLEINRIGNLLTKLLENEEVSYDGGKFNEVTLASLYELYERLSAISQEEGVGSLLTAVKRKIKQIEEQQKDDLDMIDDKLQKIEDLNRPKSEDPNENVEDEFEIDMEGNEEWGEDQPDFENQEDDFGDAPEDDEDDDELIKQAFLEFLNPKKKEEVKEEDSEDEFLSDVEE